MAPALREPEKIERCVNYTGLIIFSLSRKQCLHDGKKQENLKLLIEPFAESRAVLSFSKQCDTLLQRAG